MGRVRFRDEVCQVCRSCVEIGAEKGSIRDVESRGRSQSDLGKKASNQDRLTDLSRAEVEENHVLYRVADRHF